MNDHQRFVAAACLSAAYDDSLTFPAIIGRLIEAGFESYCVDFRRQTAIYYLPSGDSLELCAHGDDTPISSFFESRAIKDAIQEAQSGSTGYSYRGFCKKVREAGCAGYSGLFRPHGRGPRRTLSELKARCAGG